MYAYRLSRAFGPAATGAAAFSFLSAAPSVEYTSNKLSSRAVHHLLQPLRLRTTPWITSSQALIRPIYKPTPPSRVFSTAKILTGKEVQKSAGGFLPWYEGHLAAHPVRTKMLSGCLLWGIGDAVAQLVPQMSYKEGDEPFVYDWPRTGRACFFGFALHAPTSHLHYNFLEWMTQRLALTGLQIPIFKAFMEQFVYWSWVSNAMYHGAMGAMQGLNLNQIYDRIADVLWETQKAQWVFWIPIQLVNFRYTPVRHQLNVVLLTSIVWTALLSAWYPPKKEIETEKKEQEIETEKKE